jgi:SAM-dependent methyltransferase
VKFNEFYDRDWAAKDGAPPETDPILVSRQKRIAKIVQETVKLRSPHEIRVLDASCGAGFFVRFFRELGTNVFGSDISPNAIARARRINPDTRFVVASVEEALPFDDASFDIVWFGETLAQLFDGHKALSEFNRVLKPGGKLILTTPYHGRLKMLAIVLFAYHKHFYPDNYRLRFYDKRGLTESLEWTGFTPQHWSGIGRMWPFWMSFFVVAAKTGVPGPPPDRLLPLPKRTLSEVSITAD